MTVAQADLGSLHETLLQCRRCAKAGYFIGSRPIFAGPASAQVMIVGQAPARVEAGQRGIPFGLRRGKRRSLLWRWLEQAGWPEAEFRANHYLTAITRCYPGPSPNGQGDRVPTAAEQELCRPWLEQELVLIRPKIIIPVGRVALDRFLPELKGRPLQECIGRVFERNQAFVVPLPHPSGVSRWLNVSENRTRVDQALIHLQRLKEVLKIR